MEKVVLDGVSYLKASAAAKQFKYTADYIGQLCRAKKIDARLVGRTWFVNPESLINHKSNKYSTVRSKSEDQATDITSNIKVISPVLKNSTAKSLRHEGHQPEESRNLKVAYEVDDESLIPEIIKREVKPPKSITVEPYNAKKIKVKGGYKKDQLKFESDELPDVALSGKIKVTPLAEADESTEEPDVEASGVESEKKTIVNRLLSDERDTSNIEITPLDQKENVKSFTGKKTIILKPSVSMKSSRISAKKADDPSVGVSFTPESITGHNHVSTSSNLLTSASPLIATVMAVLCSFAIFASTAFVSVEKNGNLQNKIEFQAANVTQIFVSN